jgi:hypothetical protein
MEAAGIEPALDARRRRTPKSVTSMGQFQMPVLDVNTHPTMGARNADAALEVAFCDFPSRAASLRYSAEMMSATRCGIL